MTTIEIKSLQRLSYNKDQGKLIQATLDSLMREGVGEFSVRKICEEAIKKSQSTKYARQRLSIFITETFSNSVIQRKYCGLGWYFGA